MHASEAVNMHYSITLSARVVFSFVESYNIGYSWQPLHGTDWSVDNWAIMVVTHNFSTFHFEFFRVGLDYGLIIGLSLEAMLSCMNHCLRGVEAMYCLYARSWI